MTVREVYEALLFEQNKEEAPVIERDKFVYLLNKTINAYSNEKYNFYAMKQVIDDDIEFLLYNISIDLSAIDMSSKGTYTVNITGSHKEPVILNVLDDGFELQLPYNYRHLTRCSLNMEYDIESDCEANSKAYTIASRRLTPDMKGYTELANNAFLKPARDNVYHYFKASNENTPLLVVMYGLGDAYPQSISIDYIRSLDKIVLTKEQLDSDADISDTMPFSDRICYEIINTLTKLVFENTVDNRLQTFVPINKTINEGPIR